MPSGPDPHKPLRDDVRLLGELLGDTIRQHAGQALFDRIEEVRAIAKRAHNGDDGAFPQLAELLRELPIEAATPIARAFSQFLTLANIAEQHHRVRRRRDYARDPEGQPQPGSCEETFARLIAGGTTSTSLADAVGRLRIELVLTAHPTEIVRRTLIQAQQRIEQALARRDRSDLTPDEREQSLDALRREIAIVWHTGERRAGTVSPLDEVRGGLAVFDRTLWDALPEYLRLLDRALAGASGATLSLDAAPVRFGSWIGGDRDGNPNVTPDVTRKATWMARWVAADLYLHEIDALRAELSLDVATDDLRRAAGLTHDRQAEADREPYRAVLRPVAARLRATLAQAAREIGRGDDQPAEPRSALERTDEPTARPYETAAELVAPLALCHRSLVDTGNAIVAAGRLTDILRRLAAFGLVLARLDIRQEAARHEKAIAWIAHTASLGAYEDVGEEERIAFLLTRLTGAPPSLDDLPVASAPDAVRDVIDTFRMAASLNPESLGAYVITMASSASDVLAVELLQKMAGSRAPQRVVPLFETAADLEHAGAILERLLSLPWYRERIRGRQEVMVGYSDSAKDAGRFAAAWALYRAQEQIVAACRRQGVEPTLFHGRGGSIGRGGGPTYLAIQSQPPGSVNGALRVTEQGEMIQAKFGFTDIAVRTLEVYTTATLEATLTPPAPAEPAWRSTMDRLYERARASYRHVVYEEPRFIDYFRTATPEPELRTIPIGSRPARRNVAGDTAGIESLRAIPWQFAWTQTRLLLASWLGVEDALEDGDRVRLRAMYEGWPFFRSTLDLIEMVLAKADARIAAEYDRRLVPDALKPFGCDLRDRLARATEAVLAVTGHRQPIETNAVLRRSIDVRNPYVDPINVVQIELLARLRQGAPSEELTRAFTATVNGIAAGMRNTG